jgi:hypothetical protein
MPAFIAAAKPTFSRSASTRTFGSNSAAIAPLASPEALSTTRISVDTPLCATAEASERGRSAADS